MLSRRAGLSATAGLSCNHYGAMFEMHQNNQLFREKHYTFFCIINFSVLIVRPNRQVIGRN